MPAAPAPPPPTGAEARRRLAQYELLRQVGSGAMGAVHQAHDLDLDRPVAIKLLHASSAADPTLSERFLREARSAAQLIHPHVALVYQVGRHEGLTFIVMEWLDGGDLAHAVRQHGPLPWRDALAAVRDAAAGLAAAHAAGLVHRDIKPSNLMRNRLGQVKLVDFGLARLQAVPSELTQGDGLLGTPAYLSPEQCAGEPATAQSDLYALACTAFHLLTGQAPFTASHVAAVLYAHLNKPLPDPRGWAPDVPESVVQVLQRAAAKDPTKRHASATALLADLDAVLRGGRPAEPLAALPAVAVSSSGATSTSSSAPAELAPGNLGTDTTSFIGREQLGAQLAEQLRQARLLTLTGPGGTGKTRLALHAARALAPAFPDGTWLVELAPLSAEPGADPGTGTPTSTSTSASTEHDAEHMVWGTVAALFGLRDDAGDQPDDPLLAHLAGRALLIVLDNCEHLLEAAAALARRVLAHAPRVRILATSRQPLGVAGEQTLAVPPLATGEPDATATELAKVEAVRLFAERAAAARPGFTLGPDNATAVAQICRRLDGIPLAIELAAARTKVLAPAQIAARLDDAFKLLTGGQRTLLPRQQTLRALIDWSWNLLDEGERRLLARCSVFAGDFSFDAAEAVLTGGEGEDDIDVLDGLSSLVDKSLLLAVERGGEMRYRLLETIRQYGAERLQAAGETEALQRRHASFYAGLVCDTVDRLNGDGHDDAAARLLREHDNARAALDAVTALRAFDTALPLARGLADYWFMHGALGDGVARLQRLMALEPPPGIALAELIRPAGTLAMYLGLRELAQGWFESGLQMARDAGSDALQARMLASLGALSVASGEYAQARRWLEEALAQCERVGDKANAAKAHNNLGIALSSMGDTPGARRHLLAALALHRASNRRVDLANGLMSLAELEQAAGASADAQGLFESSLGIFASLGDDWSAAYARDGLGRCALDHGDIAGARQHFEQALDVLRRRGDKGAIADQLDYLAHVALMERQHDEAVRLADESLALRLELKNPAWLAVSMETHAALHVGRDPERSARLLGAMAALQHQAQAMPTAMRERRQQVLRGALTRRLGETDFERLRAEGAHRDPAQLARGDG